METAIKIAETFSTSCGCYDCNECGILMTSDDGAPTCEECDQVGIPSNYCYDACWDYKVDNWKDDFFPNWVKSIGTPEFIKISGKKMGWTGAHGYAIVEADWDRVYRALTLNGEYRLEFILDGTSLEVTRYSHDEPTGAFFTLERGEEE